MIRWRFLKFNEENSVGHVGTILHQRFNNLVRVLLLINTAIIEKLLPEYALILDSDVIIILYLQWENLLVNFLVCLKHAN